MYHVRQEPETKSIGCKEPEAAVYGWHEDYKVQSCPVTRSSYGQALSVIHKYFCYSQGQKTAD